jgi:hypothetical protein
MEKMDLRVPGASVVIFWLAVIRSQAAEHWHDEAIITNIRPSMSGTTLRY